jgi:hypothetical protein
VPNPRGQIVCTKKSWGMSMREFWVNLFIWNEIHWDCDPSQVLTDEEIEAHVAKAYPDRAWSKNLAQVQRHRAAFNRGKLMKGRLPAKPSFPYTRVGDKVFRAVWGTPKEKWLFKEAKRLKEPQLRRLDAE